MLRSSRSETLDIRGLRYHLRCWSARATAPRTVVMLHGWMDVSASFQFVADALGDDWAVVAPDWRGYGLTDRAGGDCYWFPDYLADLDRILDHISPGTCAAGRPQHGRQRRLDVRRHSAGARARGDQPRRIWTARDPCVPGARPLRAVARRAAQRRNVARLCRRQRSRRPPHAQQPPPAARTRGASSRSTGPGRVPTDAGRWRAIAAHRVVNPTLYRLDEVLACWRRIACPVLWVRAADTDVLRHVAELRDAALREVERRRSVIVDCRRTRHRRCRSHVASRSARGRRPGDRRLYRAKSRGSRPLECGDATRYSSTNPSGSGTRR